MNPVGASGRPLADIAAAWYVYMCPGCCAIVPDDFCGKYYCY